jgi:uncharacterized protein YggT (Ycf19 family)
MALALLVLQQIIMIAGLALLAQFVVGIFAWGRREANPIYRFFRLMASPFVKVMRLITPKFVPDQHVPIATFLLLSVVFLWLGLEQRNLCMNDLAATGCERWREARGATQ